MPVVKARSIGRLLDRLLDGPDSRVGIIAVAIGILVFVATCTSRR